MALSAPIACALTGSLLLITGEAFAVAQEEPPLRFAPVPAPTSVSTIRSPDRSSGTPRSRDTSSLAVFHPATGTETRGTASLTPHALSRARWQARPPSRESIPGGSELARAFDLDLAAVPDPSVYPWSAQVRLFAENTEGQVFACSGTLIDPKIVVTAAHCLHPGPGGDWMTRVTVHPAWDGDDDAFGAATAVSMAAFTEWTDFGAFEGDMGFLVLDRPLGYLTGVHGFGFSSDDTFYQSVTFHLAGYPAAPSCYPGIPDQLYHGLGTYDLVIPTHFLAEMHWTCDTFGMSGAGAYWIDQGTRYVHGVHSFLDTASFPLVIGHTRVTPDKFDALVNQVVPGAYPTAADFLPLQARAPGSEVVAGESLLDFEYLVANASEADPGVRDFDVGIYLSANENISPLDRLIDTHSFSHDFGPHGVARVVLDLPIPADIASGSYWLGVLLEAEDAQPDNNESDGWDAFPVTIQGCRLSFESYGEGLPGSGGWTPQIVGASDLCLSSNASIRIVDGLGGAFGFLWVGTETASLPALGGTLLIDLAGTWARLPTRLHGFQGIPGGGFLDLGADFSGFQGLTLHFQGMFSDAGAPRGVSFTPGTTLMVTD